MARKSQHLLPLAARGIQRTQAAVAVGLERTHTQCLGQGEDLARVGLGLRALRRLAPAFLVCTGVRLFQKAGSQRRLP